MDENSCVGDLVDMLAVNLQIVDWDGLLPGLGRLDKAHTIPGAELFAWKQ